MGAALYLGDRTELLYGVHWAPAFPKAPGAREELALFWAVQWALGEDVAGEGRRGKWGGRPQCLAGGCDPGPGALVRSPGGGCALQGSSWAFRRSLEDDRLPQARAPPAACQ